MLSGGVASPRPTTVVFPPAIFVTVYSCCVPPRNAVGVPALKRNCHVTSGLPSPLRSTYRSYRALGENVYQFGPAAGSSAGIQFDTIVTVSGLSGLRNAYRSVLS